MNRQTVLLTAALLLLAALAAACRPCSSPAACTNRGYELEQKGKLKLAASYYQHGCDGGNAIGCSNLGSFYAKGKSVEKNLEKAEQLYRKSCEDGFEPACDRLGTVLVELYPDKADVEAWPLLQAGCSRDRWSSCRTAAEVARRRGEAALPWLLRACNVDDRWSCLTAGLQLYNGVEDAADPRRAFALINRSSALGSKVALYWLGTIQLYGLDGPPNPDAALAFFRAGCAEDGFSSCLRLARLLAGGIVGAPDPQGAGRAWWRGCLAGSEDACNDLFIVRPWKSADWERRDEAGLKQLQTRCDARDEHGCFTLGLSYLTGADGVEDPARASALLGGVCERTQGIAACSVLDRASPGDDRAVKACRENPSCTLIHQEDQKITIKGMSAEESIKRLKPLCDFEPWTHGCGTLALVVHTHPAHGSPTEALDAAVRGCQANNPWNCAVAGRLQIGENSPLYAPERAIAPLRDACRAGDAEACRDATRTRCETLKACDEEALSWIDIAIRLDRSARALRIRADALCALDRFGEAKAAFEEACKLGDNTACGRTCAGSTL